ncbi:J domain-containing protein [Streptomyces sp. ISL-98]|uniref:J domain-containing protein n=1 Tax=Streptomyces sp. ISL-98 TaxID=2819192 RepID=UPI001BE9E86D|nr:J domain-containing protein [Streptomyces sp. ISL-98]MBT2507758.1 J domain-containing protein [Streptomyces sp. ISL-98]
MAGREASGRRPGHYAVLGVEPSSSAGQITSAYRRLVRALHPDANPDSPTADRRFADVVAASTAWPHLPDLLWKWSAG